jgi:hypothetical protein
MSTTVNETPWRQLWGNRWVESARRVAGIPARHEPRRRGYCSSKVETKATCGVSKWAACAYHDSGIQLGYVVPSEASTLQEGFLL